MTREEKLTTMTMPMLAEVANKLGIKIDKKGAKSKAVAKILEAEANLEEQKPVKSKKIKAPEVVESLIDLDDPVTDEEAKEKGMLSGDKALEQAVVESDDAYCADGRKYSDIGKEIAEQAKEKAETHKRQQKAKKSDSRASNEDVDNTRNVVRQLINKSGLTAVEYAKIPGMFVVKVGKKTVCELRVGRNITLNVREADVIVGAGDYHKQNNYYLPCTYKLVTDKYYDIIMTFLTSLKNIYTNKEVK